MWTVTHTGPGGVMSRGHFPEWEAAANWLRAMMEASSPPGVSDVMRKLRFTPPESVFQARIAGHVFSLSIASNEPEPATDLFSVDA